ncbi:hypothetical protein [uncultured Nostoc sp.]|uniref:hypothetical protein n=1 Tax=uncultured Nostoc sp. TaxID=340711 RepID=UPI0035CB0D57
MTKQQVKRFSEIDIEKPQLGAKDLLVRVKAIFVNPVDYKVKSITFLGKAISQFRI